MATTNCLGRESGDSSRLTEGRAYSDPCDKVKCAASALRRHFSRHIDNIWTSYMGKRDCIGAKP